MYFNRKIDADLLDWKNGKRRKPLLIRGARQVGKSRSIRNLGKTFKYFMEVNFETQPELKAVFQELSDVHEIANRLGTLLHTPVEEGETLLFIDEIQACPEALHSLWAFKEDFPGLHVAAAGSLLEFTLKKMPSFGVGRIRSMFMYPMSFDEFLMATGHERWVEAKNKADYWHPVAPELHSALVQQFRSYLMVGGMPASVSAWADSHDYLQCADEQSDIQQTYYDDFAKYSDKIDIMLLRNTLRSVVAQVGKKFVYSRVEGNYRIEEVKKALTMLCDAGIIKMVQRSSGNGLPLGAESNDRYRKYIYLDSGLMLRMLDMEMASSKELTELILVKSAEELVNKGPLAEMVAGWEIIKGMTPRTEHDLYYWENNSDGGSAEVDYLIAQDFKVIPLEVKSGVTGKMKSLRYFMSQKHLTAGKRCSLENFGLIEFQDTSDPQNQGVIKTIYIHPLYCMSTIGIMP